MFTQAPCLSPTEPTLEPQLPEADFREISEQPSAEQQQEQVSCRVLPGETADEVG